MYMNIETHAHTRTLTPIYLSICLSVCLSIYLPTYLSIHPSIHPSIHACMHTYIIIIFSRLLDEVRSTKIMCITASCGFAANRSCRFFAQDLAKAMSVQCASWLLMCAGSYHISWLQHGYNMLHTSFL